MNRTTIARIATLSLMLGVSTVACTPDGAHVRSVAENPVKADQVAAEQAGKAREALAANKGDDAVKAAERAVAAMPNDASYRLLLGQAYLSAGRFGSAETAFHDTLVLQPDQPRARFDCALAQTADGRGREALPALHALVGKVPAADLGLAIAMAGDRQAGIQMLLDAARTPGADARTRQNLALAFALDGRWREARAVAMQDTPASRINDQIARWAELAIPAKPTVQVAAMLGVKPSRDPGQPTELALRDPAPVTPATAPTALAAADPAPSVTVPLAPPAPATVETASYTPPAPGSVTVPLADPQPAVPAPAAAPRPPVMLAAMTKPARSDLAPPPLLRAPAAAFRHAVAHVAPGQPVRSGYVVQLGAFARTSTVKTAWTEISRQAPKLAGYTPTRGSVTLRGATYTRLSVAGLPSRAAAMELCQRVRAHGASCFVREAAGDAPLQWMKPDSGTQLASR
ncbi:MAG TPA: tetratricopeptide repeat protein [Sphingomonas sp.]|nr:tetratricopeptide repeat protein [Sphingomonas sp.]